MAVLLQTVGICVKCTDTRFQFVVFAHTNWIAILSRPIFSNIGFQDYMTIYVFLALMNL